MKRQHIKSCGCWEAVPWGKFIAVNSFVRKDRKSQINGSVSALRNYKKKEQIKTKVNRRKERVNISVEIGEIKTRQPMKTDETNSCFFEKISKILGVTWIPLNLLNRIESRNIFTHIWSIDLRQMCQSNSAMKRYFFSKWC